MAAIMRKWGPLGVSLCALGVALGALFIALIVLPEAGLDTTPTASDAPQVPATGVEGYVATETFCKDERTKVTVSLTPDVGIYYSLKRTTDSIPELIVITVPFDATLPPVATHWANSNVGQSSQPALVDEASLKCAGQKAQPIQ